MTRKRAFLLGLLGIVGVGAGASIWSCGAGAVEESATLPPPDPERLRAALDDIIAPERIARGYRMTRSRAALEAEFTAHPGLATASAGGCSETMRARLRRLAQDDFQRGDVLVVDRLVVARSECILAGLLA